MATVAGPTGSLPPDSLHAGGGGAADGSRVGAKTRRRTPSELRGEQLKRVNVVELVNESPAALVGASKDCTAMSDGHKMLEVSKFPRYIDKRIDEVYPAKKSSFQLLSAKENVKENKSAEQSFSLKNVSTLPELATNRRQQILGSGNSIPSPEASANVAAQSYKTIEKCNQSRFRNVAEISCNAEKLSLSANIDMEKALKGLAAWESSNAETDSSTGAKLTASTYTELSSECSIPGHKAPLDFSLKTVMRIFSSFSLKWIYRLVMDGNYDRPPDSTSVYKSQGVTQGPGTTSSSQGFCSKSLCSWIYPQSTLPSSLIMVLTAPTVEKVELDFLEKRHLAWQESFRSLYFLFRKNMCGIFYVCSSQFVVMFIGSHDFGRTGQTCSAYISRSTRGLRSLLREHDIDFSMPLCHSKVEQVATEDLVELSEIEKQNLGQTQRQISLPNIDNTPHSLLALSGNKNVHGLYDILLNYRSFLTFLAGLDVPVLYSPVPFQNAAVSAPEVRYVEMKRAGHIAHLAKGSTIVEGDDSDSCLGNTLEIKAAYLPPWIICNLCAIMGSQGGFEASFVTETSSLGLNAALGTIFERSESKTGICKGQAKSGSALEAVAIPQLYSGVLKNLKYWMGSYTASVTPV